MQLATRNKLYAKFGITAEAAQLFETELGTLLLCARALENGWHIEPDGESASEVLDAIDRSTMGRLLDSLKNHLSLGDDLTKRFSSALKARNQLIHGFFERHNFKIQTDEGREEMISDLELLHDELFNAWQIASAITATMTRIIKDTEFTTTDVKP